MWKICSKLFKIWLKSAIYDQIMFKVWRRQYVQHLSKFCSKYIPKLLKICLKTIGNLFQICPDSVHHLSNVSLKLCKRICHYPSKSAKIYRIFAEILLQVWPKCDLQNISNNCPNYCANSVWNMFKTCPQSVYNTTQTVEILSNLVNFVVFLTFMLKRCSKPV